MKTEILKKEFGNYRVLLDSAPGGPVVLITDKKQCDRTVVKIYALNGPLSFNSITETAISHLESYLSTKSEFSRKYFIQSINEYIYGTIDLVAEIEWFNPFASKQC